MSKITLATVKKFIRENYGNLYVSHLMHHDAMTDCITNSEDTTFKLARYANTEKYHLGIVGVYFSGSTPNWLKHYEDEIYTGIEVSNCCGNFILAIKKGV